MMPKSLLSLFALLLATSVRSQNNRPYFMDYFGSSRIVTKQKLGQYLLYAGYQGQFSETDSTVDLVVTMKGQNWTIYSSFYFGNTDSCQIISNTRCDAYAETALKNTLGYKKSGLVQIKEHTYVAKYSIGELLEVFRKDSCITIRTRKLNMSQAEYKALVTGRH